MTTESDPGLRYGINMGGYDRGTGEVKVITGNHKR